MDQSVPLSEITESLEVKRNFFIFLCAWTVTTFNNYLLMFLVNTYELVYASALSLSVGELISFLYGSILFICFGFKGALFLCYAVAALGGMLLLVYGIHDQSSPIFPNLILVTKLGLGCSIQVLFCAHTTFFPEQYAARSYSLCNIFSRIISVGAPILAQYSGPVPLVVLAGGSTLVLCMIYGLQEIDQEEHEPNPFDAASSDGETLRK